MIEKDWMDQVGSINREVGTRNIFLHDCCAGQ